MIRQLPGDRMRTLVTRVLSVCLVLLTGCHPTFTGTTAPRDGNGNGPSAPAGQAQITSASPASVIAGTGDFTLTVSGLYFLPTTSVMWDNTVLTTTYVSSSTLTAKVPAALIARPTTISIVPTPILSFNFGITYTSTVAPASGNKAFSITKVAVAANDLEWDSISQRFYVSVGSTNGINANSIATLNPQTAGLDSFSPTGSQPVKLAISADDAYLYAGLDSIGSVRRYTLPAVQSDIDIPLGSDTRGSYYAIDIQPQPGSSRSFAVSRGLVGISPREQGGITIYDDSVARPQFVPGSNQGPGPIDSLAWNPSGLSLYGIDNETSGSGVFFLAVSSAGVQLQSQAQIYGYGNSIHFEPITGYLYKDGGAIIDPTTGAIVGRFPLTAVQGGFNGNPVMVPDGKLNIAYFAGQTVSGGTGNYVIEAFDLTHFTLLGSIPIAGMSGTPSKMVRWGDNGLAILTDDVSSGANGKGIHLVSGGFVTSPAP